MPHKLLQKTKNKKTNDYFTAFKTVIQNIKCKIAHIELFKIYSGFHSHYFPPSFYKHIFIKFHKSFKEQNKKLIFHKL